MPEIVSDGVSTTITASGYISVSYKKSGLIPIMNEFSRRLAAIEHKVQS